ncbi:LppP/LprE family lipoprotein [Curtobacterium pusillum]|uniref:LppP/LprE family lipoprotein n=1 Tax=Curtobacterium pusillum TaxID=69373 RepID=UPI0011A396B5|nr:LppP/LprE family lipoprotein [Curtobacterium pusillum]
MRTLYSSGTILVVVAIAVGLAGCSGGSTAAPTVTRTVTASAAPSTPAGTPVAAPTVAPTPTPTPTCGPTSGAAASARAIAELPLPVGLEDARWDTSTSDFAGYDPCAPLSWAVVSLDHATGSSPVAILLFHEGRYLGTATKLAYSFVPDVTRTGPSSIAVTYHYAEPDESTADASGRTNATFTWDETTGRVDMTGDVPPVG